MADMAYSLGQDGKFEVRMKLFKDVNNVTDLKKKLMKGEIAAAVVRPSLICCYFSVLVAANKAAHSFLHGKMKTRGIHTELIYNLSPSHNISESLKNFGVQDKDSTALMVCICEKESEQKVEAYFNEVDGSSCSIDELSNFTDIGELKSMYKISEEEIHIGSLSDAVVCRIATKDAS